MPLPVKGRLLIAAVFFFVLSLFPLGTFILDHLPSSSHQGAGNYRYNYQVALFLLSRNNG